jgi:hypothetical protein
VGTLLTGVWLWIFYRRDYPYLAQHMVVALHFSCIAMTAVLGANILHTVVGSGPQNPTAVGGGRLGGAVITLTTFFLSQIITKVYTRGRKGAAIQFAVGAVVLLVMLSALILPAVASSRYLHTLLP